MTGQSLGQGNTVERFVKEFAAAITVVNVPLNINANRHNVAIENVVGGTAGTAAVTGQPAGIASFVTVFEADGTTPMSLTITGGDARADIKGSLKTLRLTLAAFDGTSYRVAVSSYID